MRGREREHSGLPIPNGWFAVAFGKELTPGEVRRVKCFDEELVLFRGRNGRPVLLDAYCPHLGAHLAEGGRVMGDTVRCPFHGWRYDATGACVEIPYCERIPAKARVRSWTLVERNHMVLAWHHAEGKPPEWEVPTLRELQDPGWTEPRTFELEVPVHMQEMAENNCDPVHFRFVHGNLAVPAQEQTLAPDGRFFRVVSHYTQETPAGAFEVALERDSWGLGLTTVRMKGFPGAEGLMLSSTSPIDTGHTISRWIFTVTRDLADVVGEEFIQGLSRGVLEDMRIWKNKVHRAHPVFCEADRPLIEFRRWARQFYSGSEPRAEGE